MATTGTDCARARESVSADLDRELQPLDLRRLQAHLRVCAECSAWADHVKATTIQLRAAPVETLHIAAFELPRLGRRWRVRPALVVAPAAALVAAVAFALGGAQHGLFGPRTTTPPSPNPVDRQVLNNGPDVDTYKLPALHGGSRAV